MDTIRCFLFQKHAKIKLVGTWQSEDFKLYLTFKDSLKFVYPKVKYVYFIELKYIFIVVMWFEPFISMLIQEYVEAYTSPDGKLEMSVYDIPSKILCKIGSIVEDAYMGLHFI